MKKIITAFFVCSFYLLIPKPSAGIEINNDSFVKSQPEEEETNFELIAPNMERAYKKEKVLIKRDLSSLDSAVDSVSQEKKELLKERTNKKGETRKPASYTPEHHLDYGDFEIQLGTARPSMP